MSSNVCVVCVSATLHEAIEELISAPHRIVGEALNRIEQRLKHADGIVKEELTDLRVHSKDLWQKLDGVLRGQRDGLSVQETLVLARERVDAVEQALTGCQEAEMPFLKGIEVLPLEESGNASAELEGASAKANVAVQRARTLLKTCFGNDSTSEEVAQLVQRTELVATKLLNFKKQKGSEHQ